jgi:2-(1,2-epoxy-1,2-dihydrophenyl)acetyl-CoA isomerase
MDTHIRFDHADGIGQITLNRPERYNALDIPTARELSEILIKCTSDHSIKGLLITGSGAAFSAGGDIRRAMSDPRGPAAVFHELATHVHIAITEIRRMRKPVLAAINGVAAGGGFSLALACDFRVMAESAQLKQGFTGNALCIDAGGTFTLPRLVGLGRAMEIAALDEPIDSHRALDWGLVNEVVPDDGLTDRARSLLNRVCEKSLHTFGWSKDLLNSSLETSLETQLAREREGLVACVSHPDGIEGMQAFLDRRNAEYNLS